MVASPRSYGDVAVRLSKLAQQLDKIRAHYDYSADDARDHALKEARMITQQTLAIVNILRAGEEDRVDFGKLIGITEGTTQLAANSLDQFSRAAYVTLFQFKIETLFKNLLSELGISNLPPGYYNITKQLMSRVSVKDKPRAQEILQVPALIRNSLHSNGYHHGNQGSSTRVQLNGEKFEFIDGKQIQCAGWRHIILSIQHVLSAIEEVLGTPEVAKLTDPIKDRYLGDYP